MTIERRPPTTPHPAAAPASELKRIPLPPLPYFRRPETAKQASDAAAEAPARVLTRAHEDAKETRRPPGSVSHLEMSELLGPDHEGGIAPAIDSVMPQRTGATGATILNDLVDQIEKGLEKDLARVPMDVLTRGYRRVVACSGGPTLSRAKERRTGE